MIDLWAADLIVTALTTAWEEEEVRKINCAVSNFDVEDGLARSDEILMDAPRLTVVGNGTIDLDTEEIDVVLKPRPKDPSLVNLARPVRISGPLAKPEVSAQKTDIYASAGWTVAGVVVPILLPIALTQVAGTTMGTGEENLCEAALAGLPATSGKPAKKGVREQDKGPGKGADQNAEGLDYDNYDDMF